MTSTFRYVVFGTALFGLQGNLSAQEIYLRAGTLMQCTLAEPNFSSRTALIGEPIICHARTVREFGRSAFPRGTYLTGELTDYQDPGRLVGKGWLKLEFDRLILPHAEVPILAKVVSVRRYRVDAEGRILGRGHPKRDALGWLLPPLWPIKLITLPMRGPYPTLKGETQVTLRLMDDAVIPQCPSPQIQLSSGEWNERRTPFSPRAGNRPTPNRSPLLHGLRQLNPLSRLKVREKEGREVLRSHK